MNILERIFHIYVNAEIGRRKIIKRIFSVQEAGSGYLYELPVDELMTADGSKVRTYLRAAAGRNSWLYSTEEE